MPARSQAADEHAVNPFSARSGIPTFPYCMWEVLIDHPEGLSVTAIVEELQQRGLRDVSGLKNPCGQVGCPCGWNYVASGSPLSTIPALCAGCELFR